MVKHDLTSLLEQAESLLPKIVSEFYYYLAVIEMRTPSLISSVPQTERPLEATIRAVPQGEYAKIAYSLLEQHLLLYYQDLYPHSLDSLIPMQNLRNIMEN